MATKKGSAIGALYATSSNTGDRVGLHVIPIDSSGTINANGARLDAISSVLGTVDDAAITAGSSGTISGKQRGLLSINADVWDSVLHRIKVSVDNSPTVSPVAGSTWATRPLQSSAADLQMTATPAAGSTWNVRPLQSSAADLQVTATIGTNLQSTAAPSSGSSGLVVRQVVDNLLTFASSNCFIPSTLAAINSTVTGQKCKVFAYSITSTNATATKLAFYAGSTMVWPVVLQAISSAISGANLAVSPPAYLFATDAGSSMTLRTPSSFAGCKVGVSYFMAP